MRSFTSGEVQKLVDNYQKQKQHDPSTLLISLWVELEKHFGSAAVITKALLERMNKTAAFSENDNVQLQEFADLCADVESQLFYLASLACLNFPNAIQPIAGKLPPSLRGKWRKRSRITQRNRETSTLAFRFSLKLYSSRQKLKTIRTSSQATRKAPPPPLHQLDGEFKCKLSKSLKLPPSPPI